MGNVMKSPYNKIKYNVIAYDQTMTNDTGHRSDYELTKDTWSVNVLRFVNLLGRISSLTTFKNETEGKLAGPTGKLVGLALFLPAEGFGLALNMKVAHTSPSQMSYGVSFFPYFGETWPCSIMLSEPVCREEAIPSTIHWYVWGTWHELVGYFLWEVCWPHEQWIQNIYECRHTNGST